MYEKDTISQFAVAKIKSEARGQLSAAGEAGGIFLNLIEADLQNRLTTKLASHQSHLMTSTFLQKTKGCATRLLCNMDDTSFPDENKFCYPVGAQILLCFPK